MMQPPNNFEQPKTYSVNLSIKAVKELVTDKLGKKSLCAIVRRKQFE